MKSSPHPGDDELARQLSKLISAMERQRREELGSPEATRTGRALHQAHRLMTDISGNKPPAAEAGRGLAEYLGTDWVDENPWAATYLSRIETALRTILSRQAV